MLLGINSVLEDEKIKKFRLSKNVVQFHAFIYFLFGSIDMYCVVSQSAIEIGSGNNFVLVTQYTKMDLKSLYGYMHKVIHLLAT